METFNFKSQIKNIQNSVLSQNIRNSSNIDLLTSEEAIKNVINSYIEKFNAVGDVLIDINNFVVESKDIITVDYFNKLIEGIYTDIYAIYSDINTVKNILDINLQRNKNYYLVLKKRIRDLWNKLNLTRSYIYDKEPANESYYESFSSDINSEYIKDIKIDKKYGTMQLLPTNIKVQNKNYQIKSVSSITYPEPSDNGGVFKTTNNLNTFEYNYKYGSKDMLENGLWKEEIYTNSVPNMSINIGTLDNPIYRQYNGVVSIIDVEYTSNIMFNRLDFDIYGDYPLIIDSVLYKLNKNESWSTVNSSPKDSLTTVNISGNINESINQSNFDVISFSNLPNIITKYLRIVICQENYSKVTSDILNEISVNNKINNDLSERRYELLKFNNSIDNFLSEPTNDQNKSLYNKIINLIESTTNIQTVLKEIQSILLPSTDIKLVNFTELLKYNYGLWSIEPKLESYISNYGKYTSNNYYLKDKTLLGISLNTKQDIVNSNTCNWYISVNNKNIPIIENNTIYRKETINKISMSEYSLFDSWINGSFIQLDYPIDINKISEFSLYINNEYQTDIYSKIIFLNSTLLFLYDIKDTNNKNIVVRYPTSNYNCVNLYVLTPKPYTSIENKNISLGIISTKKEILERFIKDIRYNFLDSNENYKYLYEDYIVTNVVSTVFEATSWFGYNYNNCIFISDYSLNYLDISYNYTIYSHRISTAPTKLSNTYSNIIDYISDPTTSTFNFSIDGSLKNITPLPFNRDLN